MMTTQTKWLLAVAGTACVGTGAWLYAGHTGSGADPMHAARQAMGESGLADTPTGDRARGCSFVAGQQLAYQISTADDADLDMGALGVPARTAAKTDVRSTTTARLELRALSSDPQQGGVLVGRFAQFAANTIVHDDKVQAPFLVRISPECSIDGFAYKRGTQAGYARVQQALVSELGWTWPHGEKGRFEGRRTNGSFVADVTTTSVHGKFALLQTIKSFEPWSHAAGSPDKVTDSFQQVVPGKVAWFASLQTKTAFAGARSTVEHTARATFVDTHAASLKDVSTDEKDYVWADLLPRQIPLGERQPPSKAELVALSHARKLTVDQAVDQYVQRVEDKNVGIKDTWPGLRTFLEAKPDAAQKVVDKMKRGEIPAQAAMGAYIALGKTRTPQAKAALEGVMRDEQAPVIQRSRAILSLIDRADEGEELASYLQKKSGLVASGKNRGQRVLARQALLALGAMSGRKSYDDGIKQAAIDEITKLHQETRVMSALYQRPVFGALANVGDPKTLELVADIPDNPDAQVREAAAIVFRRMPPKDVSDFAARWLARERDPRVLRKLWHTLELESFDARELPSHEVLEYAVRDLKKKPGPITRKALIRLLVRAKKKLPKDDLGIEDVFAELLPYEYQKNSGLERLMAPYIDTNRREQIYKKVAQSFKADAHKDDAAGQSANDWTPHGTPAPSPAAGGITP